MNNRNELKKMWLEYQEVKHFHFASPEYERFLTKWGLPNHQKALPHKSNL